MNRTGDVRAVAGAERRGPVLASQARAESRSQVGMKVPSCKHGLWVGSLPPSPPPPPSSSVPWSLGREPSRGDMDGLAF